MEIFHILKHTIDRISLINACVKNLFTYNIFLRLLRFIQRTNWNVWLIWIWELEFCIEFIELESEYVLSIYISMGFECQWLKINQHQTIQIVWLFFFHVSCSVANNLGIEWVHPTQKGNQIKVESAIFSLLEAIHHNVTVLCYILLLWYAIILFLVYGSELCDYHIYILKTILIYRFKTMINVFSKYGVVKILCQFHQT